MILTEAGHFLKDRAVDILELSMQTEEEFERRRQALFSGQKAIGCIESESSQLLGGIIEDLLIDYPHVNFQLYSGTSDDIQDKLDKGILDFGILLTPVNVDRYQSHFFL
ncbi:LysR substrate-binding domain-containing protein [Streptococcus salivarius]|uniref:LysR substrate-binding domain-containing protein n=1 Tax=Streptococcus salivarius TaxID=1304 RepID=UPI00397DB179